MKKSINILINLFLVILFIIAVVTVGFISKQINSILIDKKEVQGIIDLIPNYPNYTYYETQYCIDKMTELNKNLTIYSVLLTAHLIAIVLPVTIFLLFNKSLFKNTTEKRAKLKAEKTEAKKQQRIAELENELNELKKE